MKTLLTLISSTLFMVSVSNDLVEEKTKKKTDVSNNKLNREIISVVDSYYDPVEQRFIKTEKTDIGKILEGNIRTDIITSYAPNGNVAGTSQIRIRGDNLDRNILVSKHHYDNVLDFYIETERKSTEYFNDTPKPGIIATYIFGSYELGLAKLEKCNYDDHGNQTSYLTQSFDPNSETEIYAEADSVKIEYNMFDSIAKRTSLWFEYQSKVWNYKEIEEYEWSENGLNSITISATYNDGSFKNYLNKITEIKDLPQDGESTDWKLGSYTQHRWDASASDWIPNLKVENIYDNTNSNHTKIISRWEGFYFLEWQKIEDFNFQESLYNLRKYSLNRTNPMSYFGNHYESSYFENEGWSISFGWRVTERLGIINSSLVKSGNNFFETDSVLTLTRQVYNAGTGEWLDDFKQEYIFRNTATSTKKIDLADNINVYPNPTDGFINVQMNDMKKLKRIDIVNSIGQTLSTAGFDNFTGNHLYNTDLRHLEKGMYFINIYSETGVITKKIIHH